MTREKWFNGQINFCHWCEVELKKKHIQLIWVSNLRNMSVVKLEIKMNKSNIIKLTLKLKHGTTKAVTLKK